MALPEYVAPVLAVAGLPAAIFVIMRCLPYAARAVVLLLAGTTAIVTGDPKRRAACYKVLNTITHRDERGRLAK
jgi:hypothetical protein